MQLLPKTLKKSCYAKMKMSPFAKVEMSPFMFISG